MADVPARHDTPTIEPESRPYWEAAAEGRLLLRACNRCGTVHHYPRPFCPACWSEDVEWVEASGRATLYTWSTVHVNDLYPFKERLPYVAAVVDLDEGPRMMTNLVDADPDQLRVGMLLRVAFRQVTEGITAPVFTLA